jgi:hypothetical protein
LEIIMRYFLTLLCAALLSGCNHLNGVFGPSEKVDYFTDRPQYGSNEAITLTLSNRTDGKTLNYNLCNSTLEEFRAGRWQATALQEEHVCTAVLYSLAAGEQASFVFDFDQPLPPGLYRFKTKVSLQNKNARIELFTNEFQIAP